MISIIKNIFRYCPNIINHIKKFSFFCLFNTVCFGSTDEISKEFDKERSIFVDFFKFINCELKYEYYTKKVGGKISINFLKIFNNFIDISINQKKKKLLKISRLHYINNDLYELFSLKSNIICEGIFLLMLNNELLFKVSEYIYIKKCKKDKMLLRKKKSEIITIKEKILEKLNKIEECTDKLFFKSLSFLIKFYAYFNKKFYDITVYNLTGKSQEFIKKELENTFKILGFTENLLQKVPIKDVSKIKDLDILNKQSQYIQNKLQTELLIFLKFDKIDPLFSEVKKHNEESLNEYKNIMNDNISDILILKKNIIKEKGSLLQNIKRHVFSILSLPVSIDCSSGSSEGKNYKISLDDKIELKNLENYFYLNCKSRQQLYIEYMEMKKEENMVIMNMDNINRSILFLLDKIENEQRLREVLKRRLLIQEKNKSTSIVEIKKTQMNIDNKILSLLILKESLRNKMQEKKINFLDLGVFYYSIKAFEDISFKSMNQNIEYVNIEKELSNV
jgi:hypothetical protein